MSWLAIAARATATVIAAGACVIAVDLLWPQGWFFASDATTAGVLALMMATMLAVVWSAWTRVVLEPLAGAVAWALVAGCALAAWLNPWADHQQLGWHARNNRWDVVLHPVLRYALLAAIVLCILRLLAARPLTLRRLVVISVPLAVCGAVIVAVMLFSPRLPPFNG